MGPRFTVTGSLRREGAAAIADRRRALGGSAGAANPAAVLTVNSAMVRRGTRRCSTAMQDIRVRDHDVFVFARPEGDRRPVVCVHSTGMSHQQWRRLARRASKAGHPVYAPDLLGYGQTGLWRGPGPFSTAHDMENVERVAELVCCPDHSVGHRLGGL